MPMEQEGAGNQMAASTQELASPALRMINPEQMKNFAAVGDQDDSFSVCFLPMVI